MKSNKLNHKIYQNFDSVRDIWHTLEETIDPEVFGSFHWCQSWSNTFGLDNSIRLRIIVINLSNKPIAIFPLCLKKKSYISLLEFMGDPFNDLNKPLISQDCDDYVELIKYFFDSIIPTINYDLLHFLKQTDWLPSECKYFVSSFIKTNTSHSILIQNDWTSYIQDRFKRKTRYKNRRLLTVLEKQGNIDFVNQDYFGIDKTLNKLMKFKSDSYNRIKVKDFFKLGKNSDTYIKFVKELSKKGCVDIKCLLLNNKIIAVHCGLIYKNKFYYLMPSYDYDFKEFSPGKILLMNLIEASFNENLKKFDLTIGDEVYKNHWSNDTSSIYTYYQFRTFFGFMAYLYFKVRGKLANSKMLRKVYLLKDIL